LRFPRRAHSLTPAANEGLNDQQGREPRWFSFEDTYVVRQPTWSNPAGVSTLILPRVDPAEVLETDPALLARTLYSLPFREVASYVNALRTQLLESLNAIRSALLRTSIAWAADHRVIGLLGEVIPHLLDPDRLGEAVDRELACGSVPGREFLDGWV